MNRAITKLANGLTYGDQLQCASSDVAKATMKVPRLQLLQDKLRVDKWLARALSTNIELSASLINTGEVQAADSSKIYVNFHEIAIVLHIVNLLIECGVTEGSIGVIAPYRSQVDMLKKVLSHQANVEVNTVDQYQGRAKDIIIYSCTQSKSANEATKSSDEILDDRRRLTVAITRAKHKLIMIGDTNCLNFYNPFRDLFKNMSSMSKCQVEEGKMGFSWAKLMEELKI